MSRYRMLSGGEYAVDGARVDKLLRVLRRAKLRYTVDEQPDALLITWVGLMHRGGVVMRTQAERLGADRILIDQAVAGLCSRCARRGRMDNCKACFKRRVVD